MAAVSPSWLGSTVLSLDSNNATIAGVAVNVIPNVLVSTNSGTTALPTTATAAYTSSVTLPAGTYLITCEIYTVAPTGGTGWIATDNIGWSIGATTGSTDNVTQYAQPFYVVGASGTWNINLVGLCIFTAASTIRAVPTYNITNTGGKYAVNSFTYQKVA
jgi:hypothetical protein